jgi:hypothetical protein
VYNYIVFEKVGDQISPQLTYDITNVVPFVIGLVLLSGLSFTTSLIFRHLSVQLRLAKLYDNFISNVTHELKSGSIILLILSWKYQRWSRKNLHTIIRFRMQN